MGKLNLLSLHTMGDPRYWRKAVQTLEYMIPAYAPEHNCIVHDASLPVPAYIEDIEFHAIFLGPTFLCARHDPEEYSKTREIYDWVEKSEAIKIALPQDDYDSSAILDQWVSDWNVDRLYTVCPAHWDVLYPEYGKLGDIRLGYTGYISDQMVDEWRSPKSFDDREIDVSYRASGAAINFCSVRELKSKIASTFERSLGKTDLNIDVSTDPRDLIFGSGWHHFVENSRFCLVTPSGSSLLDPYGKYRRCVNQYALTNPNASFEEVSSNCFAGEDKKYSFTALSPRNIEAALACTVQIATPGSYSGLMKPMEHFIPLEEDCSNINEVLRMMNDRELVERIRNSCKEMLLDTPQLFYKHHVSEMVEFIQDRAAKRNIVSMPQHKIDEYVGSYHLDIEKLSSRHWRKQRIRLAIRDVFVKMGISGALLNFMRKIGRRIL